MIGFGDRLIDELSTPTKKRQTNQTQTGLKRHHENVISTQFMWFSHTQKQKQKQKQKKETN